MTFIWPTALLSLLAIPLIVWFYLRVDGRRTGASGDAPTLGRGPEGSPNTGKRRHIPVILAILALSILFVGFARPQATVDVPQRTSTVVLAFDTSASMLADVSNASTTVLVRWGTSTVAWGRAKPTNKMLRARMAKMTGMCRRFPVFGDPSGPRPSVGASPLAPVRRPSTRR